jgi:hypothetical protein
VIVRGKRRVRSFAEALGNGIFPPWHKPVHLLEARMCQHQPRCPDAPAPDHQAARVVAAHPEQGWSLLCNGVLLFDDAGELLPDGRAVAPEPTYLVVAA